MSQAPTIQLTQQQKEQLAKMTPAQQQQVTQRERGALLPCAAQSFC
jgi:hypothetical protein